MHACLQVVEVERRKEEARALMRLGGAGPRRRRIETESERGGGSSVGRGDRALAALEGG